MAHQRPTAQSVFGLERKGGERVKMSDDVTIHQHDSNNSNTGQGGNGELGSEDLLPAPKRPFPFHRKKSILGKDTAERELAQRTPQDDVTSLKGQDQQDESVSSSSSSAELVEKKGGKGEEKDFALHSFYLTFNTEKIERAYWESLNSHHLAILRFSYLAGLLIELASLSFFLHPPRDLSSYSFCSSLSSTSATLFLLGLGYTATPFFNFKVANHVTFFLVLSSITSLVAIHWYLVRDLLHGPGDHDDHKDLYTIFHPYGYLLMLIAFVGVSAFSKLRFTHSLGLALYSMLMSSILWFANDSPLMDYPTIVSFFVLVVAATLGGFIVYSYFNERKRRVEFMHNYSLKVENTKLEAEVKALRSSTLKLGKMSTPIEEITKVLMKLAHDPALSPKSSQAVEQVIDMLTGDALFIPDVEKKIEQGNLNVDTDTKSWLLSEVTMRRHSRKFSLPMIKKSSLSMFDLSRLDTKEYAGLWDNLNNWNFDVFRVEQNSPGNTLNIVAYKIIQAHGLIDDLHLDEQKLMKFLTKIEQGYKATNPYHNSIHAADVVQSLSVLISTPVMARKLSSLEKLAVILAGAIHDYDHPGVSNNFLVKTRDPLAILYNDQSPLENHHLAASFEILLQEGCDLLSDVCREDQDHARRIMIDLVLATDNARHFNLTSSFNAKVNTGNLDIQKPEDITLLLQMLIKCADVSNPGKQLNLYKEWMNRIVEEFFRQGDRERELGLPISPFMDRETPKIPKSQVNFIEFICAPVYHTVGEQLNFMDIYNISQTNLAYWKEQMEKQEREAAQAVQTPPKAEGSS